MLRNLSNEVELFIYEPILKQYENPNLTSLALLIVELMKLLQYDNSEFMQDIVKNSLILIIGLLRNGGGEVHGR